MYSNLNTECSFSLHSLQLKILCIKVPFNLKKKSKNMK